MDDGGEDLSHDHAAFLLRQSNVPAEVVEKLALVSTLKTFFGRHLKETNIDTSSFDSGSAARGVNYAQKSFYEVNTC
jgi:hypothetical protein